MIKTTESPAPGGAGSTRREGAPAMPIGHLDALWFQVTGTQCNLTCSHCFIACSPTNHSLERLDYDEVVARLGEARALGVKEYYFTGGEPFLHPRMADILGRTLEAGPATVLTNCTLLTPALCDRLKALADGSPYGLELRISIDGFDAAHNDALRGAGSFAKAMAGVRHAVAAGFLPIITAVQTWEDGEQDGVYQSFLAMLVESGYRRPRVKLLPRLKLGAEAARTEGYRPGDLLTAAMMDGADAKQFVCSSARIVTSRGVAVCPILADQAGATMAPDLAGSLRPYRLGHPACVTCWRHGAICSNLGAGQQGHS